MLKRILEFTGLSGFKTQAREICQNAEKQPPNQAASSLLNWLPNAMERCDDHQSALELLNLVSPSINQVLLRFHHDLMASEGNLVRTNLLLQGAIPLTEWMRDQYFTHLHQGLCILQKNGPLPLFSESVARFIDWHVQSFLLAFLTPPAPTGFDWHKVYPIFLAAQQTIDRSSGSLLGARPEALKQTMNLAMARLLLAVRSLSGDLSGRQALIGGRIVDVLHPFIQMSDMYSRGTPYGTNIHDNGPPTVFDGDKTPREEHHLFFGVEQALIELVALESHLFTTAELPARLTIDGSQTSAETLTVIKHLKNRWSGRQVMRKSQRTAINQEVHLVHGFDSIRKTLQGDVSQLSGTIDTPQETCILENMSATGFGLLINTPSSWAAVGTLIAIFQPEAGGWSVGCIRRILPKVNHKALIGMELLAYEPEFVRITVGGKIDLEMLAKTDNTGSYPGILLPASPLNSGQPSLLLADRLLTPGHSYTVEWRGEKKPLMAKGVQEIGADHVQFGCSLGGIEED